ncbi:MAG: glycosyltransferase family 1 protein [Anaerolineales bacterium]|nr:glycosyltransferase family 1 protein [Anaerolineales bacterium]
MQNTPHKCAIISLDHHQGSVGAAIKDGFLANGLLADEITPSSDKSLHEYDFLLLYGPMLPITPLSTWLTKQRMAVPPILFWFTEQLHRPQYSKIQRKIAKLRAQAEIKFGTASPFIQRYSNLTLRLLRAGRLRAFGEILNLNDLGYLKHVFVFSQTHLNYFRQSNLPVDLIPMGYHPQFGQNLRIKKDIDVVFLGSTRDHRRRKLIQEIHEDLHSLGIHFEIRDGSSQHGYAFGEQRTRLINRSRIMLNIMRQPWDDPCFRMLLAAPNRSLLISESLLPASTGLFTPGEHLITANLGAIVDTISRYLSDVPARERIVEKAYDLVTNGMTMEAMTRKIITTVKWS